LDYAEIIAEQLNNNADSITDKCKFTVSFIAGLRIKVVIMHRTG
jgi:hypothetical protein